VRGQSDKFPLEIEMILPRGNCRTTPLQVHIRMLNPTIALFHGYGGDATEVGGMAHIAFLKSPWGHA